MFISQNVAESKKKKITVTRCIYTFIVRTNFSSRSTFTSFIKIFQSYKQVKSFSSVNVVVRLDM